MKAAESHRAPMLLLLPALAASLYGWAVFVSTWRHPGSIGINYIAPGTDWMVLYSGIHLALNHQFALTFDGVDFTAYLNRRFANLLSAPLAYRPWVYPPSLLVMLIPFSRLGFLVSYVFFQVTSAALSVAALLYQAKRRRTGGLICAGVLICPAASIIVTDGQLSFLVAAVLVLGLKLLPVRPLLAGAVLGLLSVKPQFAVLVPIALLATRQWRAGWAAAGSALALAAVSAILFGAEPWVWWLRQIASTYGDANSVWVRSARLWGNSVYACAVLLGLTAWIASLLQAIAVVAGAVCVYVAFRWPYTTNQRLVVFLAAAFLAAPHCGPYDAILLTIAGLLWYAEQVAPRLLQRIIVLALWLSPQIGPPALMPIACFTPLLVAGFIVLVLRIAVPSQKEPISTA